MLTATTEDASTLADWLATKLKGDDLSDEHLEELAYKRLREIRIEPPTRDRIKRIVRSASHSHEKRFFDTVINRLSAPTVSSINNLLDDRTTKPNFTDLKADAGLPGIESFLAEIAKLRKIRGLGITEGILSGFSPKFLARQKQRVATEFQSGKSRHPDSIKIPLVATFCHQRGREITDGLVDLLIHIIHRIGVRSEKKVEKEMLEDLKKVSGKNGILYQLAEAAIDHPDGVIREVVFPVVSEKTLRALIKEFKATGPAYRSKIEKIMRSSYGKHYIWCMSIHLCCKMF